METSLPLSARVYVNLPEGIIYVFWLTAKDSSEGADQKTYNPLEYKNSWYIIESWRWALYRPEI
jgi:hypothetical protein